MREHGLHDARHESPVLLSPSPSHTSSSSSPSPKSPAEERGQQLSLPFRCYSNPFRRLALAFLGHPRTEGEAAWSGILAE